MTLRDLGCSRTLFSLLSSPPTGSLPLLQSRAAHSRVTLYYGSAQKNPSAHRHVSLFPGTQPPVMAPPLPQSPTCFPCPLHAPLTSALPTVPLPDGLGHLLSDPDAVPMEPLIAVVTPAAEDGASGANVRGRTRRPRPASPAVSPARLSRLTS